MNASKRTSLTRPPIAADTHPLGRVAIFDQPTHLGDKLPMAKGIHQRGVVIVTASRRLHGRNVRKIPPQINPTPRMFHTSPKIVVLSFDYG